MTNLFLQMQQPLGNSQATDVINQTSDNVAEGFQNLGAWIGLTGPVLSIVGGILLLIIGYFVAKFIGNLVKKALLKTGLDNKNTGKMSIASFIGKLVYYLLMIIILMATLNIMGVSGDVLSPLNLMVTKFFSAIPNIVAAAIIAYVGYFLAKIVSNLVEASGDKIRSWTSSISTTYKDKNNFDNSVNEINKNIKEIGEDSKGIDIVKILKNLVFIFIFVPILVIALDKLDMYVITLPLTQMLSTFINAIPDIIYAVIILLVVIIGGKYVVQLLKGLLNSLNVNSLSKKLKIDHILGNVNLVQLIGNLVYVFIVYLGIVEAANHLGLDQLVEILNSILEVAGKIVFGLVILAIGNAVANFAAKMFANNKESNRLLVSIVKATVLIIFLAMGLTAMGIADRIIELAFGLGLGALAVAFALAFGLGGREAAGEEVKEFFKKLKNKNKTNINDKDLK